MSILDSTWKQVKKEYQLKKILGQGAAGQVVKAIRRSDKK